MVEYLWMHVLAELHHEKPVAEPELGHDKGDVFSSIGLRTAAEHKETGVTGYYGYNSEAKEDGSPTDEKDVPKPQKDVNFLIDDIEGKNTEAINVEDTTRWTIFVECTF